MIQLYTTIIRMKYAARMAYRADFFMSLLAFGTFQLIGPLMMIILYGVGVTLEGWTLGQIMLLLGFLGTVRGFAYMVWNGIFWETQVTVRNGTFDKYLTKPITPFFLLLMNSFDEEDLGQFLAGLIVLTYALVIEPVQIARLWILPVAILAGGMVYLAMATIFSAITIILVHTNRLGEFFIMIGTLGSYPKTMYGRSVSILVGAIIPIAVAAYYPVAYMLGFPIEGYAIGLIATFIFLSLAILIWHVTLKKYRSAGG